MQKLKTYVEVSQDSDFSIYNLPFGVGLIPGKGKRVVSRIGEYVLDLEAMEAIGVFSDLDFDISVLRSQYLNDFIALGKNTTIPFRQCIQSALLEENAGQWAKYLSKFALPSDKVEMTLPVQIGDYTDFYSSIEHATNVGIMFRDPDNALLPNWRHLPVAYHGRASSIQVSGVPVRRPMGQIKPEEADPVFGPSRLLDFELEMAFVVGKENALGKRIPIEEAESHIFGLTLFNDWSARDIQKWEYIPLGPFIAKNFHSTISPWIVTLEALEPFRVQGPKQEPAVLPYLASSAPGNFDIELQVDLIPKGGSVTRVCRSNFKYMYWNMAQQLAHHSVGGCNMRVGDFCASGTISGKEPNSYGSMLELSWKGTRPLLLEDGGERKFVLDGDTIVLRGYAEREGIRVGFGEASAEVLAAE
jgi:fumarylacetoacetase